MSKQATLWITILGLTVRVKSTKPAAFNLVTRGQTDPSPTAAEIGLLLQSEQTSRVKLLKSKLPLTLNTNVTQWFQSPYFVHQAWHWTTKTRVVPRLCPCQATVYRFNHSQTWGLCLNFFILCVWVFRMPEEGIRSPETGVIGSF